jgi:hypothetical protein
MSKSRENYLPRRADLTTLVVHYEDHEMAQQYPALYQLMSQAKVDGRYRAGARLSLFCDDGKLKASIWDPDTAQVWFATLEGFQGGLEAIEALVKAGRGEWRARRDDRARK